jgi:hypothetical protein
MNWFIIIFVFVAVCLFLITKYYLLEKKLAIETKEHFENEKKLTTTDILSRYHNVKLNFLSAIDARDLIEINGDYFKNMNKPNLVARGCETIDELYNKYLDGFNDITKEEKAIVSKFILKLLEDVKNRNESFYRYLVKWLNKISIAKAKPWLENGMPHTLKTTIIMDVDWFKNPRYTTLIHELTHINQRIQPFEFDDLYESLGYIYYPKEIKGLEYIYELNRNNPDGISRNWIWNNKNNNTYWWIGAIFKNVIPANLGDVNLIALKLEKSSDNEFYYLKQNPTPLIKLKDFDKLFGENQNNYHPNEMGSKLMEWFLEDILRNGNNYYNYSGYLIFKKYFQNIIDKYY